MKKVYVVSSGSYSAYDVLCACDSKDRAERIARKLRGDDGRYEDAFVEELPVIDYDIEKLRTYRMSVNVWDNGTADEVKAWHTDEWPFGTFYEVEWRWVRAPVHGGRGGRIDVWGTNPERVRRVLSEKRAQLLADPAFRVQREAKGRGRPTRPARSAEGEDGT